MRATQAALGRTLPAEVLAAIDSCRRTRRCRAKTAHDRQALYLAHKWVLALRRKAAVAGDGAWLPWPLARDFRDGRWVYAPYVEALYAWYRAEHGL